MPHFCTFSLLTRWLPLTCGPPMWLESRKSRTWLWAAAVLTQSVVAPSSASAMDVPWLVMWKTLSKLGFGSHKKTCISWSNLMEPQNTRCFFIFASFSTDRSQRFSSWGRNSLERPVVHQTRQSHGHQTTKQRRVSLYSHFQFWQRYEEPKWGGCIK